MLHVTIPDMWNNWYNALTTVDVDPQTVKKQMGNPQQTSVPLSPMYVKSETKGDNSIG